MNEQPPALRVIWFAMFAALLTYAGISALLANTSEPMNEDALQPLRYGFTVAGIVIGAASIIWRRRFLPSGAHAPLPLAQLQTHSIIVWAMSEAVAVLGLILSVLTHSFREFVPFGLAAAGLLALHRPSNLPSADAGELS
jgi:F0F1-type ATP synthase membrane subunit c/vacuolar-type H+-ATPase subunit K